MESHHSVYQICLSFSIKRHNTGIYCFTNKYLIFCINIFYAGYLLYAELFWKVLSKMFLEANLIETFPHTKNSMMFLSKIPSSQTRTKATSLEEAEQQLGNTMGGKEYQKHFLWQ